MPTRNLVITLRYKDDGTFCATVDVPKQGVDRTDIVRWRVRQPEPREFPRDAVVAVDFPAANDPLIDGVNGHHRGNRTGGEHKVTGRVGFVPDGSYPYYVSWVDALGNVTQMLDPELVVEGGPGNVPPGAPPGGGKHKKKAGPQKPSPKAAQKAGARKKAAKKAKKAKAAKRSTKRKAKKAKKR